MGLLLHLAVDSRRHKSDVAHVDGTNWQSPGTELGSIRIRLAGHFEGFFDGEGGVVHFIDLALSGAFGDLAGPAMLGAGRVGGGAPHGNGFALVVQKKEASAAIVGRCRIRLLIGRVA